MIYGQINVLTQNKDTPDLPFDNSQPDSGDKRAAFERYMAQLDIPRMSQTVLETVRKIDALADTLEPLTPQSKQQQLARLEELEAENASLGRQLEVLTAQAGLSPSVLHTRRDRQRNIVCFSCCTETTYGKIAAMMQAVSDDRLASLEVSSATNQTLG